MPLRLFKYWSTCILVDGLCSIHVCKLDDELPDYIMVMVANKKSASQMAEDLSLFLSDNTQKFTAW
jgi:hypothetical protein